jgi:type I restriction enzyme, S subunit
MRVDFKKDKIKNICKVYSGATPSTTNALFWNGDIPWITPNDLSKLKTPYFSETERKITTEGLNSCSTHLMPKGTLVMSSRAPIGYLAIAETDFTTNQGCKSFAFNDDHDSLYFFYCLQNQINKLRVLGEGTTFAEISKNYIEEFEISFPQSKTEQTAIANILKTSDAAIEESQNLIAKYQRIKTGLMQDLLTKGIDAKGNIRNEKTHRFKTDKGLRVPVDWEVVTLETICKKIADRDHTTPKYVEEGIPIISPKDFNEWHEIEFSKCLQISVHAHLINRKKTDIEVDDLIFTRIGAGLGKICKVTSDMPEFSILHSACMIKPNREKVSSDYLLYFMKSFFAQKQVADGVQSIGVPDLGMDKIRTFLIKKPKDIYEQNQISQAIVSQDLILKKEIINLKKLHSIKTGLMQDLLSGKVRVN